MVVKHCVAGTSRPRGERMNDPVYNDLYYPGFHALWVQVGG